MLNENSEGSDTCGKKTSAVVGEGGLTGSEMMDDSIQRLFRFFLMFFGRSFIPRFEITTEQVLFYSSWKGWADQM